MTLDLDVLARDAVSAAPEPTPISALQRRAGRSRQRRRIASVAITAPLVLLVALGVRAATDDRHGSQVIAATSDGPVPTTSAGPVTGSLGEFVWPAPPRDFSSKHELNIAFVTEVLGWPGYSMLTEFSDGGSMDGAETLVAMDSDATVRILAVETEDGWGYVEIGEHQLDLAETGPMGFAVEIPDEAARTIIEVRFADGTIETIDLPSDGSALGDLPASAVVSVLMTHYDADGNLLEVTGGIYSGEEGVAEEVFTDDAPPSQSPESAARDGIVPELAELPSSERISPSAELVETPEGVWMVSTPAWTSTESDDCLGDRDGVYGVDFVCAGSYAEVLLFGTDVDLRAYPFVEVKPFSLFRTDDAIYCGRGGDGGVPESMLCRIDRETLEITVVVFAWLDGDTASAVDAEWWPASWSIDAESGTYVDWQAGVELTDEGLVVGVGETAVVFDPVTLEPIS